MRKILTTAVAVVVIIGGFLLVAQHAQANDKPAVCHPVNGKGELGNGWDLISPDKASSHINEALYPNGHYWKHEAKDGRHDEYAVNGKCGMLPTPTPDPIPSIRPSPSVTPTVTPTPTTPVDVMVTPQYLHHVTCIPKYSDNMTIVPNVGYTGTVKDNGDYDVLTFVAKPGYILDNNSKTEVITVRKIVPRCIAPKPTVKHTPIKVNSTPTALPNTGA
jgi:hypothetical protein